MKDQYTSKIDRDNHVHYSYIPTITFLDYHAPVDGAIHNLNLWNLCMWEKFMLSPIIIVTISFGLSHYSYTYSKGKHRDVHV